MRNIRNGDISAIPGSYPVMWIPIDIANQDASHVEFRMYDPTNDGDVAYDQVRVQGALAVKINGSLIQAPVALANAGGVAMIIMDTTEIGGAATSLIFNGWSQAIRGTQGEWVSPVFAAIP